MMVMMMMIQSTTSENDIFSAFSLVLKRHNQILLYNLGNQHRLKKMRTRKMI